MLTTSLATGLSWPEGPSLLPDGRIVFVETYLSRIGFWAPDGTSGAYAETGGGPNATALGSDGSLYVTQNGGVVGPWRAATLIDPSIQRIAPDGTLDELITEVEGMRLQAPNDLAFGPDGTLYFTDPGRYDQDVRPDPGYIMALEADGTGHVVERLEPVYPNGIVVEADGSIVWAESYTRHIVRRRPDGARETLATLPEGHIPDGLAVADNGDLYVTSTGSGGLDIVSPSGGVTGFVAVGALPTNCAFEGDDLIVTDGGVPGTATEEHADGVLWRVALAVKGMPLHEGRIG